LTSVPDDSPSPSADPATSGDAAAVRGQDRKLSEALGFGTTEPGVTVRIGAPGTREPRKAFVGGRAGEGEAAEPEPHPLPRTYGGPEPAAPPPPTGAALADGLVSIPAGAWLRGEEKRTATLPAYRIDRDPVTHGDYEVFVLATGHRPPLYWKGGRCPEELRDHPVVGVDYFDAIAYARWAKKDLPFEDELERAARGTDGRTYPWGEEPDLCANTARTGARSTIPVGFYAKNTSPDGCRDMVGNVWELTHSSAPRSSVIVRGGSWFDFAVDAKTWSKRATRPDARNGTIGFRCVVRPAPRTDVARAVPDAEVDAALAARRGRGEAVDPATWSVDRRDLVPDFRRLRQLLVTREEDEADETRRAQSASPARPLVKRAFGSGAAPAPAALPSAPPPAISRPVSPPPTPPPPPSPPAPRPPVSVSAPAPSPVAVPAPIPVAAPAPRPVAGPAPSPVSVPAPSRAEGLKPTPAPSAAAPTSSASSPPAPTPPTSVQTPGSPLPAKAFSAPPPPAIAAVRREPIPAPAAPPSVVPAPGAAPTVKPTTAAATPIPELRAVTEDASAVIESALRTVKPSSDPAPVKAPVPPAPVAPIVAPTPPPAWAVAKPLSAPAVPASPTLPKAGPAKVEPVAADAWGPRGKDARAGASAGPVSFPTAPTPAPAAPTTPQAPPPAPAAPPAAGASRPVAPFNPLAPATPAARPVPDSPRVAPVPPRVEVATPVVAPPSSGGPVATGAAPGLPSSVEVAPTSDPSPSSLRVVLLATALLAASVLVAVGLMRASGRDSTAGAEAEGARLKLPAIVVAPEDAADPVVRAGEEARAAVADLDRSVTLVVFADTSNPEWPSTAETAVEMHRRLRERNGVYAVLVVPEPQGKSGDAIRSTVRDSLRSGGVTSDIVVIVDPPDEKGVAGRWRRTKFGVTDGTAAVLVEDGVTTMQVVPPSSTSPLTRVHLAPLMWAAMRRTSAAAPTPDPAGGAGEATREDAKSPTEPR